MARQKESENGTGGAGRETVVKSKAIKGQEREKDDEDTCFDHECLVNTSRTPPV